MEERRFNHVAEVLNPDRHVRPVGRPLPIAELSPRHLAPLSTQQYILQDGVLNGRPVGSLWVLQQALQVGELQRRLRGCPP